MDDIRELAAAIDRAHRERRLLDAAAQSPLDLRAAYAVQRELTALRMARGAHRIGVKLNTADGSSAAGVALGPPLPLDNLAALPVRLVRNGATVAEGTGAAAMGDPLQALDWVRQAPSREPGTLRPR